MEATDTQVSMTAVEQLGPARVLGVDEESGRVQILLPGSETGPTWAQSAVVGPHRFEWGQTVLAAGREGGALYILGVLDRPADLRLRSGVRAEREETPESETLRVFSERGEMMFEYDSATGKARVGVPSGDLEIVSREGNIDFVSAEGIRFFAKNPIEMRSLQGISLASASPRAQNFSALELGPEKLELRSPSLAIQSDRGRIHIQDARFLSQRVTARIGQVKLVMDRIESVAGQVIQKAKNLFQTVEQLSQLRAGRLRTLVDETYQLKSQRAVLKAQEDFKIRGDQIHLG